MRQKPRSCLFLVLVFVMSFAVLGGGFSGVEVAGEIFDLIDDARRFYPSIRRDELRVTIIQGPDRLLPELPAALGEYALRYLTHWVVRDQRLPAAVTQKARS